MTYPTLQGSSAAHPITVPTVDRHRSTLASGQTPSIASDTLAMPGTISPQRRARIDAWRHEIAASAVECNCITTSFPLLAAKGTRDSDSGFVSRGSAPQSVAPDGRTRSVDGIHTYAGKSRQSLSTSNGGVDHTQSQSQLFSICHNCARLGAPVFMGEVEVEDNNISSGIPDTGVTSKFLHRIARYLSSLIRIKHKQDNPAESPMDIRKDCNNTASMSFVAHARTLSTRDLFSSLSGRKSRKGKTKKSTRRWWRKDKLPKEEDHNNGHTLSTPWPKASENETHQCSGSMQPDPPVNSRGDPPNEASVQPQASSEIPDPLPPARVCGTHTPESRP